MDWLKIEDQDNQDMSHEFIGNLIMQEGFKVRYNNVEVYSENLRNEFLKVFGKNGYSISIIYKNNFAYCEITALRKKNKYMDYALALAGVWGTYRLAVHMFG